ncbi:MAG: response regulator transcription factor [Acidobacteria bacterium]|nr:response regulator transcription factor [Acidobacteriota bacterium]
MSILVIDDHDMILRGAAATLHEEIPGAQVVVARTASEALEKAAAEHFAAIVADLNLPGRGGLDMIRQMRRLAPRSPIIVHSMHTEEQFGLAAMRAGARGYVCKADGGDLLAKAVRTVISGRAFVSDDLLNRLAFLASDPDCADPHEQLSDRELEVYRLIVDGKSGKEIAHQLSLSPKTVSTYRARLLEKMRMQTESELFRYALERRLFSTD